MGANTDNLRDRSLVAKIAPSSLLFYAGTLHSQWGQDGILAEIFRRLRIGAGTFVEFGAWDGIQLSNSRYLYEKGWKGVFIEADRKRFGDLTAAYAGQADMTLIHARVGAPKHNVAGKPLATLLHEAGVDPADVSFVSIDVDGPDLEIFFELGFRPPVVLMEGGFNFTPYLTKRIPAELAWRNLQQPLAYIVSQARRLGYTAVCFYQDTYFVRDDLVWPAGGSDALTLYADAWHFMPHGHRQILFTVRSGNGPIRSIETAALGRYCIDPLGYGEQIAVPVAGGV